ncbi:MAG: putative Ig domain-containing protein [Terriglobales bacterium]
MTRLVTPLRPGAQFGWFLLAWSLWAIGSLHAQQVGTNVNMVTGTQWPGGDPFLQRQNEPSMAVSSRNPLHMVAGDNDYRSVDLPAVSGEVAPTGDAWLGWFTSFDGGQTWTSVLVPGYPQDTSLAGELSPIHGLGAGADPMVRAGTNGMFYYSGLAFNRQAGGASKVFVATYTDDNNLEGGDSIRYLWTTTVDTGTTKLFEDKPAIAVDIPRSWSGACIIPALPLRNTQIFRAGTVYAAWTQFTGPETNDVAAIMFSKSIDCGLTWSAPVEISGTAETNQGAALAIDPNTGALYITWRVFASTNPPQADAIMYVASFNGGATFTKPALVADINAFDQGDTPVSFRTNDYPTIAVDDASHVYLAWAQREVGNAAALAANGGDARIVVSTGTPTSNPSSVPLTWSAPLAVDPYLGRGHQIMPGMAFSAGKLTVAWYDLRNDDLLAIYTAVGLAGQFSETLENDGGDLGTPGYPLFGNYVQDPAPPFASNARRQTLDVRAAQAMPGDPPTFFPSVQVTDYAYGSVPPNNGPINPSTPIQQLQVDPPNLPMFQSGTLPFFGDYIDVAGPTFIPNENGTWRFNNLATDPDFTHVVWADNRDVVPPADGNWANYTPPTYPGSPTSIFDPTQTRPACTPTTPDTGDRNQNIYTAQLAPGLVLSAPGNSKPLGTGSNGQLIQRQFAIVVANTTAQTQYYELSVEAQPTGGAASFLQFAVAGEPFPLTQIQVEVPALSTTSRGIFITSTVANATVTVSAAQLTALGGTIVPGGETAAVTINGDPNNPASQDPNITSAENYTPAIATPNIANPNIANPNIANPNIANPNIANPNIANPNIANPNIANPNIANPNIANPNIANPNIANTDLSDGTITDGTWAITNTGNTSSAYAVNLIGQSPPPGIALQLIVYGLYTTPLVTPASGCTLITESHFVPVANIISPSFSTLSQLFQPAANNPTLPGLALKPGETKWVTVRVYDPTTNNPAQALLDYNPITAVTPAIVSQGANTGTTTPPATLTIVTKALLQATVTGTYPAETLEATGGTGAYTWSIISGTLPSGISLTTGVIAGTPTGSPGTSSFTVQVKDAAGDIAQQPLTIVVNPAPTITTTSLSPGDQGSAYSQPLSASGGTQPLSAFSISSGSLPLNLSLSGSSITGMLAPTATTSTFTVKITDANGVSATQPLAITVNPPPMITTTFLPTGEQGRAYPPTITATGGTGTLSFSTQTVDGLVLTASGGFMGVASAPGSFPLTATVTDTLGVTASASLTLTVNAPLALNAASLPAGNQYVAYPQQQLVASNGVPPYGNWTWVAAPGSSLPPGLSLNQSSGIITGAPTTPGAFSFIVSVSDSLGATAMQTYSVTVIAAGPVIGTSSLPNGQYNSPYTAQTLSASSGTAPYTWTLGSGGLLPAGMTLSPSGTISGTPAQAGMWSIPITVTDANSLTANGTLALTVGLATGYAGSGNCYMPYPTTPMYYFSNGTAGPWSVTAPGVLSGQMTFLPAVTVTVAGYVSTNGTTVTWYPNQGGQNDQFVTSPTPSSIVINGVTYTVASVNVANPNSNTTLTLTQSAGVQTGVPYSYTLPAGANMLTGCLSGETTSGGSNQLQFTAGTSTFTLPLQIVAADTQDNGTVNVNSNPGVGGYDVPPSGFQQGVVTSGQSFTFLPVSYAADSGFNGNALVGFTGAAPQLCYTFGNLPNSLTASSQPGRYDIAIDGTTQACPVTAFPTSPAPIVFESVDTLPGPTFFGGAATISGVVLSDPSNPSGTIAAASNVLEITSGASPNPVSVAFSYAIDNTGCPGCINQLQVGLNTDATPQTYAYWGGEIGSGSASLNLNVPNLPGRYYIAIDFAEDYGFLYSSPYWWNGQPTPTRYIGVVDVW